MSRTKECLRSNCSCSKLRRITRTVSWTYLLFSRANKTTILGIALSGQELHHLLTGLMFTAEIDLVSQCYCTLRNHVNSRKPSGSLWGHFLLKRYMYLGPRRCVKQVEMLVCSMRKQPTFHEVATWALAKRRLSNECRNSILMTCLYPDLGSASDWLKVNSKPSDWLIENSNQSEALPRSG